MIPKPPPREGSLGFYYIPPYRVQGFSIAGEVTTIQIPELDVCFDMGQCPRAALSAKYCAISHGHMDHIGGLPTTAPSVASRAWATPRSSATNASPPPSIA